MGTLGINDRGITEGSRRGKVRTAPWSTSLKVLGWDYGSTKVTRVLLRASRRRSEGSGSEYQGQGQGQVTLKLVRRWRTILGARSS